MSWVIEARQRQSEEGNRDSCKWSSRKNYRRKGKSHCRMMMFEIAMRNLLWSKLEKSEHGATNVWGSRQQIRRQERKGFSIYRKEDVQAIHLDHLEKKRCFGVL